MRLEILPLTRSLPVCSYKHTAVTRSHLVHGAEYGTRSAMPTRAPAATWSTVADPSALARSVPTNRPMEGGGDCTTSRDRVSALSEHAFNSGGWCRRNWSAERNENGPRKKRPPFFQVAVAAIGVFFPPEIRARVRVNWPPPAEDGRAPRPIRPNMRTTRRREECEGTDEKINRVNV